MGPDGVSMAENRPWRKYQPEGSPEELIFDPRSLYQALSDTAAEHPDAVAWNFMGTRSSYTKFREDIDRTALALSARGVKRGDVMTVCLPNCPQALFVFYALNRIGAIASMIHPLSVSQEIRTFLDISASSWIITLDAFWPRVSPALEGSTVKGAFTCRIQEYMPPVIRAGFYLAKGRKIRKVPAGAAVPWKKLMASGTASPNAGSNSNSAAPIGTEPSAKNPRDTSVILYSGGTTGTPKGIMLSDWNFNALTQALNWQIPGGVAVGDKVLSILPLFHGFGLGVTANLFLTRGGTSILVPQFSADAVIKMMLKNRPQFIAGVPTLFEAMSTHPKIGKVDFSGLKGCYGGGDKVPETVKKRFDEVIKKGGGTIELLEGYGLTETVTACTLLPPGQYRKDSIGIPLPGILAKVVEPESERELSEGEEGELCISGPTNMLGYYNLPGETAQTIRRHADGQDWVHTGDLCSMDREGFIFFRMRLKRMVKVSGIAVYPPQVEELLRSHEAVRDACVIGIPDPYKMNVIRAYVVPETGVQFKDEAETSSRRKSWNGLLTNSTAGACPGTSCSAPSFPLPGWEKSPSRNWRKKLQRKPKPAEQTPDIGSVPAEVVKKFHPIKKKPTLRPASTTGESPSVSEQSPSGRVSSGAWHTVPACKPRDQNCSSGSVCPGNHPEKHILCCPSIDPDRPRSGPAE